MVLCVASKIILFFVCMDYLSINHHSLLFSQWDSKEYAIVSSGGNLMLNSNLFKQDSKQVQVLDSTKKAIITNNLVTVIIFSTLKLFSLDLSDRFFLKKID